MKISELSDFDLHLFHEGTNFHAYNLLGAHVTEENGEAGVRFSVWAPHAKSVSVVGDFNNWDTRVNSMQKVQDGETWTIFIPGVAEGSAYKYAIMPQHGGPHIMKADPYGFFAEVKPDTASRVYDMGKYEWHDQEYFAKQQQSYTRPMLTYEVHAGSWRRTPDGKYLSYRDMADQLVNYVKDMNYTHIEFMPLCEHPFDGSWGYKATGYYAVTSRYGTPDDFRYLVDKAHEAGIGIIMDWVPGHFCKDDQGLRDFDGTNLYESDNSQLSDNAGWGTTNFDYGRTEVQSFLISNAMFWLEQYHIDGLRIDAVANMLYLNYGRESGEWTPNKFGGNGNLEAMEFLKKLNMAVFKEHGNALMIAEESTSWPMISRPVEMGGMGFNYKWNMGWMNDILKYVSLDPIYRKWHQDKVTFSLMYAFNENFVLPLSHDEVVHGKCSLISKMPGDYWQQFAGLRAFFGYWMAHPGKKLLFMGGEFGQFIEWKYDDSLDWHLVEQYEKHGKMLQYSKNLNKFYVENKAMWEVDFDWSGFEWINCNDNENSVISFIRKAADGSFVIAVCNFTPEVRHDYRIGVPLPGAYVEVFNSDADEFGGSNVLNEGDLISQPEGCDGREQSLLITVPPLATCYFRIKDESSIPKKAVKKAASKKEAPKKAASKKAAAAEVIADSAPAKKKPGRKPKAEKAAEAEAAEKPARKTASRKTAAPKAEAAPEEAPAKKKPGRKPKAEKAAEAEAAEKPARKTASRKAAVPKAEAAPEETPAKKKPGRKPKAEKAAEKPAEKTAKKAPAKKAKEAKVE